MHSGDCSVRVKIDSKIVGRAFSGRNNASPDWMSIDRHSSRLFFAGGKIMVEVQVSKVKTWQQLGQQLRVDSIRCTTAAGSGHPTSSMSAADLMSVLMTKFLRYDFNNPTNPNNDHLIFSKGHACPLLYS